ncbi:MAG TPA: hypothetical protein VGL06_14235 [Pseudonocardiaceae bacterium]
MAVINAIVTPGYFMPGGTRLSEIETMWVSLGGRQAAIRPCVLGAKQATAQISPKHVRVMTNVVTDALTGIPPSAQRRT